MTAMSRRLFLEKCGLGALAAGLSPIGTRRAEAAPGDLPAGLFPADYKPVKILEIYCYGGMSQWETFWVNESTAGVMDWRGFPASNAPWLSQLPPLPPFLPSECAGIPNPIDTVTPFALDSVNTQVWWGPATVPLCLRPDIFNRARMIVNNHLLLPHAPAASLALTGRSIGRLGMAGKGAAIQRHESDLRLANGQSLRPTPFSYVLAPENMGFLGDSTAAAMAIGRHPGYAQPMMITLNDPAFADLLGRGHMVQGADELIGFYRNRYGDHLRFQGAGDIIRSAGFASYDTAVNFLLNAAALAPILNSSLLTVPTTKDCAPTPAWSVDEHPNRTRTALNVATVLLTAGEARYVCVFDGGVSGGGYDTHGTEHLAATSSNVFNLCSALAAQIQNPGDPPDPNKLDLDKTMIVINTEFGRQPAVAGGGGREHWPFGYAQILIGGPANGPPPEPASGLSPEPAIAGAIDSSGNSVDESSAVPFLPFSPTDVHAAVLLAAGVNPIGQENFHLDNFSAGISGSDPFKTLTNLKTKILGWPA